MSRPSVASFSSRLVLAGAFVFAVLTACESSKTAEQSAGTPDVSATTETAAPPVTPPPAPPESMDQEASPPPVAPARPARDMAPRKRSPPPEPRVLANEVPSTAADAAPPEATPGKAPDTTRPTVTIKSPAYGTIFNRNPVTISGTVDDGTATVMVNGVHTTIRGGTFKRLGDGPISGLGPTRGQTCDL
jgi:hypothetical protein